MRLYNSIEYLMSTEALLSICVVLLLIEMSILIKLLFNRD